MPVTVSERRRAGYRITAREIPGPWLAGGALVALALLLYAGGGPLRPALATFAIGVVVALAFVWLHGAIARRRAEAAHAAVLAEGIARLRARLAAPVPDAAPLDTPASLAADLALLTARRVTSAPASVAAVARDAAAAVRAAAGARDVRVIVVVEQDAAVGGAGLARALLGLLRAAVGSVPAGSTVELAVRSGRVELRDAADPPADRFALDLARALVQRDRGDLHVFGRPDARGTLTVLTLPAR